MDENKQKIRDFVNHLLSNPNIKNEPLLIGEGLLLNFIIQNMNQLKATFKSPQFFPNLQWNEVLQLIISDLYERIMGSEFPVISSFIEETDFDFLNKLTDLAPFANEFHRQKIITFVQSIFKNKDVRYNFNSVINIFKYKAIDKYVQQIFIRRDYLYNELVRVQKIFLESEEYINFLKIMLLVRNAAFMKIPINPQAPNTRISLNECVKTTTSLNKFIEPLANKINEQIPGLDKKVIKLAIKSNVSEKHTEVEDASSRFLYIFIARHKNYKTVVKVDRGAESPDKSWFGIARRNADAQGFDRRMLEELYRIAGDNNW